MLELHHKNHFCVNKTLRHNENHDCISFKITSIKIELDSVSKYHLLDRYDCAAQLAEHWASLAKVVGSIPAMVRHIFQVSRCGYRLKDSPQTSFSPKYISSRRIENYQNWVTFPDVSRLFMCSILFQRQRSWKTVH